MLTKLQMNVANSRMPWEGAAAQVYWGIRDQVIGQIQWRTRQVLRELYGDAD